MAGTFPGVSGTQQQDTNGDALAGCLLYVYLGGTTTPASTFQDIGLLLPAANPLVGDDSGRIPLFFVADGTYHVRLTDAAGSTANGGFDYAQVPSIGASSSGGGGTPVDPTTVFSTGDWKWRPSQETLTGWVRLNGRTIGSAVSGATERANSDTSALFSYIWGAYTNAQCPVSTGRGANAAADFAANKTITTLDMRGVGPFGLDDMGSAAKGALTAVPFSIGNATTGGSMGGEALHVLLKAELPSYNLTINTLTCVITGTNSAIAGLATGTGGDARYAASNGGGGGVQQIPVWTQTPANALAGGAIGGTLASGGSGTAMNNTPLICLGTHYWKL